MLKKQLSPHVSVSYYFLRSKDVHEENGVELITLFSRLVREFTFLDKGYEYAKRESVWVEIDEVKLQDASAKLREMPNMMQTYTVNEAVFKDLYRTSQKCPEELFFVTPMHYIKTPG